MSRIGKAPVKIPSGVNVTLDANNITVSGTSGSLTQFAMPELNVTQEGDELIVSRKDESRVARSKHGLMRTLLSNMVIGVSEGFSKKLELTGVGYRVALTGQELKLNIGFSHDVIYKIPEGIKIAVEQNTITVSGASKQAVGQVAAEIRALKKPEPYKGKGIAYVGERILRKSGKSGKEKA